MAISAFPRTTSDWILLAAALLLLLMLGLAAWQQEQSLQPVGLIPAQSGKIEYCLTCHADLPEISASHPVQAFGCVICHGGERLALQADLAHSSLRGGGNPSDFSVVETNCGGEACHSGPTQAQRDHIQRARTSLQATYAGAIANMRFTFGAQPDLQPRQGIVAVSPAAGASGLPLAALDASQESSPSLIAFARNCLNCHLYAEPLPGPASARLTGCAACHTPTAGLDLESSQRPALHRLATSISYTQCNTCHNRGNYNLRSMQFEARRDAPRARLQDYYQPIAQFTRCEWTLDCIDCHTRQEGMGDGNLYGNKKEIQYVRCSTCHGTLDEPPRTHLIQQEDELAMRLARLNPVIALQVGDTILTTEKNEPLWNIRRLADGRFELIGKATRQRFIFRSVQGTACQQDPQQQNSAACHACHAIQR